MKTEKMTAKHDAKEEFPAGAAPVDMTVPITDAADPEAVAKIEAKNAKALKDMNLHDEYPATGGTYTRGKDGKLHPKA